VGQGTTFELYLPASLEAKPADTAEREVRMPRGHGELILVVDDEATVRGTTQRVLEKSGYRVLAAAEGEAALVLYAQHRTAIKAVLADMMMPGMDGPKLVRALRQLDARLPILGMTGLIKQGPFKGLDGLDAVPLLAKPFEVEKLLEALRQTLTAGNPTTGPAN
jgi:CheY-like chemotaxis protein